MWYFLRVLWREDGLSQRELSRRAGTMEPTTMSAIVALEKGGLARRRSDARDARMRRVHLTPAGKALERKLMPIARDVVETATRGLSPRERQALLAGLRTVTTNCDAAIAGFEAVP